MTRMFAAALGAALLTAGMVPAAIAGDGHGNAKNPALAVPNTGEISGGPTHSNDPRVRESREIGPDGRPVHHSNDGHAHGHSMERKAPL